ncbi:MAG TPA: aldo/keto reductase [Candidatus Faecivicinus avistercoris]|nr:aldo/keto reductase [Candidatus Faecivicinus avistercoris]
MQKMILGRTGLEISRTGFGALPIQRVTFEEAAALLNRAVDGGICYIDTARAYTDSEEKIGRALSGRRSEFYIATKTHAKTGANLNADLETSLKLLNTDVIDVYQFHNPPFVPVPGGEDGLYDAAVKAREAGKIRFIGITQHSIERAEQAVESGLYDTLQYPFNHLATEREIALVRRCREKNVGFVAMKALSGGLVTDARLPFAFLSQFENAVPIWGFQKMEELEQLLDLSEHPIGLTDEIQSLIQKDRSELVGSFCRSCGYCMPCPVGIQINQANRMKQLLGRAVWQSYVTPYWQKEMERIEDCIHCGACAKRCPYELKPYETLPGQLAYYREFVKTHAAKA